MPFYDYKCSDCGHVFEAMHGIDECVEACEACGGAVKKLFSPVGIIFKGSGFYSTDYRSKSSIAAGGNGNGEKKETEAPKPAPAASKPDKAPDKAGAAAKASDKS